MITPWLLWYLYQSRNTLKNNASIALLAFIPFVLFGILSFKQLIGLHWLPAYLPALLLLICLSTTERQLNRAQIYTFGFGFIHAIIICIAIFAPSATWKDMKFYENKVASRQECKFFDYMFIHKIREVLRSKDICTETEEATTTRHDENKVQQDRNNGQLSSNYRLLLVKLILHF